MIRMLALVAVLAALAGCLPIELDVSPTGQVLVPREEGLFEFDPETGQVERIAEAGDSLPAFALYVPGSDDKVHITAGESGGMGGGRFTFNILSPGGKSRVAFAASNVTYASISPNGKHIGVSRVADDQSEKFDQNMPELLAINIADGGKTAITSDASSIHRWMPDGKHLLVLHLLSEHEDADVYTGQIAIYDLDGKQTKVIGTVVGPQGAFLDVSPDGSKLLFTATNYAPGENAELRIDEDAEPRAYLVNIDTGEGTAGPDGVKYAIWSPDGRHILSGSDEDDGTLTIKVHNASLGDATEIATDAAAGIGGGFGPATDIYPGWVDNDTIYYLARKSVYGTAGKNLLLATVGRDGSNKQTHQHTLDAAAR